jgi:hypothetical protein
MTDRQPEPSPEMRMTFGQALDYFEWRGPVLFTADGERTMTTRKVLLAFAARVRDEERERCVRDACGYCAGHYPQYERRAIGPNAASNWTHAMNDEHKGNVRRARFEVALCKASSIFNRAEFERRAAIRGQAEREPAPEKER